MNSEGIQCVISSQGDADAEPAGNGRGREMLLPWKSKEARLFLTESRLICSRS